MSAHACPGGCGRDVGQSMLACSDCWRRLPIEMRNNVLRTWRVRQLGGDWRPHVAAVADASRWFREHPGATS